MRSIGIHIYRSYTEKINQQLPTYLASVHITQFVIEQSGGQASEFQIWAQDSGTGLQTVGLCFGLLKTADPVL